MKEALSFQEKEIARTMMKNNDYSGARGKLLKARKLNPKLEDTYEMLTVCEILLAAGNITLTGLGTNWYSVLQTTADVDESHINFKYKKFTNLLEPIKNKIPGTESALKLIKEAYSVLSDREKRSVFDSKRAAVMTGKGPDIDFYDFDNKRKIHLFAVDQIWAAYDQEKMPRSYARINNIGYSPFRLHLTWLKPAPDNEHEKTWHEVGLPICCGYFQLDETSTVMDGEKILSHLFSDFSRVKGTTNKLVEIHPQEGEVWALYEDWRPFAWCNDPETRKGCGFQIVEILTYCPKKGWRVAPLEKVSGLRRTFRRCINNGSGVSFEVSACNRFGFSHSIPAFRFTGRETDFAVEGMLELDPLALPENMVWRTTKALAESRCNDTLDTAKTLEERSSGDILRPPPLTVDSKTGSAKWSPTDFTSGQIWAVYDGLLPRRYALVNKVVSGSEVCVTYLEPNPVTNDEIRWIEKNLPFVCGLFKTGRITLNLGISQFSHLVINGEFSTNKPLHRIYPKKGQIWAMYMNWNLEWTRPDFRDNQYWVVEILSDFTEGARMMRIASLIEVSGHTTFFKTQMYDGFQLVREVAMKDMLSFSHQIPAFIVPGSENHGIPEGSWFLEPDALPPRVTN